MDDPHGPVQQLRAKTEEFRSSLGVSATVARVIGVVGDIPCPTRCMADLRHPVRGNVDAFYGTRHSFLQRLLVERIRLEAKKAGWGARLSAEEAGPFGHNDVSVQVVASGVEVAAMGYRIVCEIKGGKNFSIEQGLRYLADESVDALVVVMAGRGAGGVFSLTKSQGKELLDFFAQTYAWKIDNLLGDENERVAGPWCSGCQILDCAHSKPDRGHTVNFDKEFTPYLPSIPSAISRATSLVLELLRNRNSTQQTVTVEETESSLETRAEVLSR